MELVRFYFDPRCPWCWQTSRWARRLEQLGEVQLEWVPFSLEVVNLEEGKDPKALDAFSGPSLRTALVLDDTVGADAVGAFYLALGHPDEAFDILIVQLVTLLRDGQPVRMSKRRGEFVLMEELLDEVGRDAARFTFLTRRHDSPLEFDLAVATRQSADTQVF